MAFNMQTPQRPLPGAFLQTPAPNRNQQDPVPQPALFRQTSNSQQNGQAAVAPYNPKVAVQKPPTVPTLQPIERAARTINDTLIQETQFPELDSYVGQGISSDYDVTRSPPWSPFQMTKLYDIPDKVFEHYNRSHMATFMGLFAEINHAWITMDNSLYLWDYTHPNPELVGFEEQPNSILSVTLTIPRAGVFIPTITHLLMVATSTDIYLVGLSAQSNLAGGKTVSLFDTKMSASIRGMTIGTMAGSSKTGRIFFSNKEDNDVYELTYQQEEKWFSNRCGKINHTTKGIASLTPSIASAFTQKAQEHIVQMLVDDTRNLLYTLSSTSTIRTFQLLPNDGLNRLIVKPLSQTHSNITHLLRTASELLTPTTQIVSISTIPASESSKLHLMATTSTGCRLFLSATASYSWGSSDTGGAPTSMQIQHVRFPPPETGVKRPPQNSSNQMITFPNANQTEVNSKSLLPTRKAKRFPPGYFFCFTSKEGDPVFLSSPDTGRIARRSDPSQAIRYYEYGQWLELESFPEDVGLMSAPFSAAPTPTGFGNELAIQFDKPATQIAILTNTGVHTFRRRRLVDVFSGIVKYGGNQEGLDNEIKKFISVYGRGEAAATALAVACGQGIGDSSDSRASKITDPEITAVARRTFIEYGGKPLFNENAVLEQSLPALDGVRPSPRHEGLALYMSRLIRSIWKSVILSESVTPTGGLTVLPVVSLAKLRDTQADLSKLQEFLTSNKTLIDGLSGPETLQRASTKQEEIALQAEHRALHSLIVLMANVIEGISFVLVLFDEMVDEIILSLPSETRQQVRQLTYEGLFTSTIGKSLAKDLVKAIVNRNIANGSNVETIAGALRRRCGSFCGEDDVITFKAQEQLKRASEAGGNSEFGRNLLRESLKLFQDVSGSLSMEHLEWAVDQYIAMSFYAGAIQLSLAVAKQLDRGNVALSWITDGRPQPDSRQAAFDSRKKCYNLTHKILMAVDASMKQAPTQLDGQLTLVARRRDEAYAEVNNSDDEVFHTDLYDWYRSQGLMDRLLEVQSPYIVSYLRRISEENADQADLLWRYFVQADKFYDAAGVQFDLAKSDFDMPLEKRIEYLSRARANASTQTAGVGRQPRQLLIHDVSDLLDVANIQDDLLQRQLSDDRHTPESRAIAVRRLNGKVLSLTDLHNQFADPGDYYDICLFIYQAADHRNPADIKATWGNLLKTTHEQALKSDSAPWEAVADQIRTMGKRLNLSESTFPLQMLIPMLEKYAFEFQNGAGPVTWVMDTFLSLEVPFDSILPILEAMFYNDEAPFQGQNRRVIARHILYVVKRWLVDSMRSERIPFGGENIARHVSQLLLLLQQNGLVEREAEECRTLRVQIEQQLR